MHARARRVDGVRARTAALDARLRPSVHAGARPAHPRPDRAALEARLRRARHLLQLDLSALARAPRDRDRSARAGARRHRAPRLRRPARRRSAHAPPRAAPDRVALDPDRAGDVLARELLHDAALRAHSGCARRGEHAFAPVWSAGAPARSGRTVDRPRGGELREPSTARRLGRVRYRGRVLRARAGDSPTPSRC